MSGFVSIRKSQIYHYLKTPLYIENTAGKFVLYKAENTEIDFRRFHEDECPQLFISEEMSEDALSELQVQLRKKLIDRVKSGDLRSIKTALCEIVEESFQEPLEENLRALPQTIEIIYDGFSGAARVLRDINGLQFGGTTLAEHSVNVMVLVFNYCIFNRFNDKETKNLSLCALLHDIGLTKIPKSISGSNRKLSNTEFVKFRAHPSLGHDLIRENDHMEPSIALGVLEHHERLDGQGYPRGISNITFEGRLVGMLDCFDNLTNTEKRHRKKENPFGALKIIQDETLKEGKFDKNIYRDLCLSLIGKRKYTDL